MSLNFLLGFTGVPSFGQEVLRVAASMRDGGIAVLLVEQNVRTAVEIADRAYVLDDGLIVFEGPAAEFAQHKERVRALGGVSGEVWTTDQAADPAGDVL
jgi:branched-chain amino acid transport system ATP-binding protein